MQKVGQNLLQLNQIGKKFDAQTPVLENINLILNKHEFVSVIGRSGCGKSTLLNILAGLIQPDSGLNILKNNSNELKATDISYVFQDPTLLPWATVSENIELPAKLARIPKPERTALSKNLLKLVGLETAKDQYPRELSGGMKMRASIARALIKTPKLLLLDEPFGSLDAMSRHKLNEELLNLYLKDKWSAIFVTHSVTEAVFLSNRVLVMSDSPGTFVSEINIDLDYPRTQQTRESDSFQNKVVEVFQALKGTAL